jgi:hypothetical protein
MPKFEAHITLPRESSVKVGKMADSTGWMFSAIDGDPLMGKRAYCYLTAYDTSGNDLLRRMRIVADALRFCGVEVLREKVEQILFDTKTNVNELEF